MVQLLLNRPVGRILIACGLFLLLNPASATRISEPKSNEPPPPDLLLMGGRKLTWERSYNWEREVKPKRGFWNRLV